MKKSPMRQLFLFILFSTGLFHQKTDGQVIVNEFSAANLDGLTDNYGEHEDWIELYNAGTSTVDLAGYFLSDNINNSDKWPIPAGVNIAPGEFLIIFASDRDEVSGFNNVHAGFKLTQTQQEYIALFDPQENLVDAVQILQPNQANHSTGRLSDGSLEWGVFQNPSPGGPNAGGYAGYAPKPVFSHAPGFYPASLSLVLSAPSNLQVRYTLDGSEPTPTSPLFTAPLLISQTTVVKARVISNDAAILPGFTEANTYFIGQSHTIPVISISGNDVGILMEGAQNEPRGSFEYFDGGVLADEAYGEYNKHGNDSWAYAQRGIDYITRDQLGYASSIGHQIFPGKDRDNFQRIIIKAAANDNYPFAGGAHIRDAYIHALSQEADLELDERTYEPCVLYVNGKYWGVYEIREKVDDSDFTRHYYDQGEKWIDYIKTWGGTWEEYGSRVEWDQLHSYILGNDMSDSANYEYVKERLNVLSLIDYMIINTHVVCMDWLNWNTAWWRGRKPDGGARQWRYTLWDMDATFGHYVNYTGIPDVTPSAQPCFAQDLPSDFEGHGDLVTALMANQEFHSLYVNRYADLNNSFLGCDYMQFLLDSVIQRIETEMPGQIDRWGGSISGWEWSVNYMKDYIEDRCALIDGGIVDCYDVEGPYPVTVIVKPENVANKVKVNTFTPQNFPVTGDYFEGTTLSFKAQPLADWELDHWEVQNNPFAPDQYAEEIQLGLSGMTGDTIYAFFRPSVPCAGAFEIDFDSTMSSITLQWQGPSNAISYELGYRKSGSGDSWETVSVSTSDHTIYGLDVCTKYDIRLRSICSFALGAYQEYVQQTACLSASGDPQVQVLEWQAYPNPWQDRIFVDVILEKPATNVDAGLYLMDGRLMHAVKLGDLSSGQHRFELKLPSELPAAMYLLRLSTDRETMLKRVVKTIGGG
jgi:hypothetical protein